MSLFLEERDEPYTTPERIGVVLSEVSSTRWPIAVSLAKEELTATELAKVVGKSVSWTLKQAKQMEAARILKSYNDPLNQSRGRVYALKDGVKDVLEQFNEYGATLRSLERGEPPSRKLQIGEKPASLSDADTSFLERIAEIMTLDAEATALEYGFGFVPVTVKRIETGDKVEYQPIDMGEVMVVAKTLQKFLVVRDMLGQLASSVEPMPRSLPQANPSE